MNKNNIQSIQHKFFWIGIAILFLLISPSSKAQYLYQAHQNYYPQTFGGFGYFGWGGNYSSYSLNPGLYTTPPLTLEPDMIGPLTQLGNQKQKKYFEWKNNTGAPLPTTNPPVGSTGEAPVLLPPAINMKTNPKN